MVLRLVLVGCVERRCSFSHAAWCVSAGISTLHNMVDPFFHCRHLALLMPLGSADATGSEPLAMQLLASSGRCVVLHAFFFPLSLVLFFLTRRSCCSYAAATAYH